MRITWPLSRRAAVAAAATALSAALAGCGSSASPSASGARKYNLPADVKSSGVLKVATNLEWAPYDYVGANGKPAGLDIQLVTLIARQLGLKPQFTNVPFPDIVPGVANGRFDLGVDDMNDTVARQAVVRFVDYLDAGLGLLIKKGTNGISATDLCGHTLAVTQGSSQVQTVKTLSGDCVKSGKPAIRSVTLQDSATTILAVANGRAQGFLTDKAVGLYSAKTQGANLELARGTVPGSRSLVGLLIGKNDIRLAKAVQAALQSLVADGQYAKLLAKYSISDQGVPKITINGTR